MGCNIYRYNNIPIDFRYADDEFPCVCTFPYNNRAFGYKLEAEDVRSLALLGAAIVMIHNRDEDIQGKKWITIPDDLPDWVTKEICRLIPDK